MLDPVRIFTSYQSNNCLCHHYIVSDNNSRRISRTRCFLTRPFGSGRKNSVSCTLPYGVMQETLFLSFSDYELYNLHATSPTDTFHAIVDTVSCIMHYGFNMLSDVFGHYSGIIGLKIQFYATNSLLSIYSHGFLYFCGAFAINAFANIM